MSRILIFDSGVGNRPISAAINSFLPAAEMHLLSDTAFFPYGEKTDPELTERAQRVLDGALHQIAPDIVVLACNTLSTIALQTIRSSCAIPVVGVVPAIKPAAAASKSKVIGLLATPATIHREYTNQLIRDFASDCEVIKVGSTALVKMAERYVQDKAIDRDELREILKPLTDAVQSSELDQVVLGCTHFPLLKTQIEEIMNGVEVQDSSAAIGRQVCHILNQLELNTSAGTQTRYYRTDVSGGLVKC